MQESCISTRRVLAFAAVYVLWGGAYLAIRFVVQVIPPFLAAGIRYSLSATILLGLSLLLERNALPSRRQFLNCAATGVMMFAFGYSAIYWAETRLASWLVAVLSSSGFLWTYVGECVVLRTDRLRARTLLPLAGGLAGMGLLVRYPARSGEANSVVAACVVLASVLSWSGMTLVLKQTELPGSYLQTAGLQLGSAAMVLVPLSRALGEWQRCPDIRHVLTVGPVLGMAYLVVGGSVLAFTAFHWLLAREPPSLVATSTYVNPIVAMLAGIVFVHERYSALQLSGAAVVLGSVVLVWRAKAGVGRSVAEAEPA